jgi:hypothetical protein
MKYKITLGEHCFGSFIRIDDKNIIEDVYSDCKLNQELVQFITNNLLIIKDKLSQVDYHDIMSILYCRTTKFSLTEEEFETLEDEDNDAAALMCYKINYDLSIMLDEVKLSAEKLDNGDWTQLVSILLEYTNSILIESDSDRCDQCSNINWHEEYEIES